MHSNFLHIEDNTFLAINGIYGVGYAIELPEKYSLSEEDFDLLNDYWHKAFAPLKNAIIVKHDFYIKSNFDTSKYKSDNFLQQATKDYFSDREYLQHYTYIFFLQADFDTYFNKVWYNPFSKVNHTSFEKFDEKQQAFKVEVQDSINYIAQRKLSQNQNIKFSKLTTADLVSFENFYFSGLDDGFTTNIYTENKSVYSGDKKVGIFTVNHENSFSEYIHSCIKDNQFSNDKTKFFKSYADNFAFNLNFNHIYSQVFFIDDSKRTLQELEDRHTDLFKARAWSKQNEVAANQAQDIISELLENDHRFLIRGQNAIIYFADNDKDYKSYTDQIKSAFKDLDIKPHYNSATDRIKADYFLNFPTYAPYLNHNQTYKLPLDCACALIQNTTRYKEDKEGIIFNSRIDNTPIIVDDYFEDKKYDNARNAIIIGPTGYGKSTLLNHKVRYSHERGDKIVIVDYGGSFTKYSHFYPNDVVHVKYENGKPLGFNIFNIVYSNNSYQSLTPQHLNRIVDYLIIHLGNIKVDELEREIFKKIITLFYDEVQGNKDYHIFYDWFEDRANSLLTDLNINVKYFDIEKILLLLKRFSAHGEYYFLYKSTEQDITAQFDKNIIIFELEQASTDLIILSSLLFLIDVMVDEVILKDTSIRGNIFIDEVAKMYKYEGILQKIELLYQTIRKKEGAITQVLQTIHQLPQGNVAKSIIENTQVLYVLYAKDYKAIQEAFKLPDQALYELQSLQSNLQRDENDKSALTFSELFLMRGNNYKILRLELPPEVFWSYQTDGKQNAILMEELEKTQSLEKAIKNILTKKNSL